MQKAVADYLADEQVEDWTCTDCERAHHDHPQVKTLRRVSAYQQPPEYILIHLRRFDTFGTKICTSVAVGAVC